MSLLLIGQLLTFCKEIDTAMVASTVFLLPLLLCVAVVVHSEWFLLDTEPIAENVTTTPPPLATTVTRRCLNSRDCPDGQPRCHQFGCCYRACVDPKELEQSDWPRCSTHDDCPGQACRFMKYCGEWEK